MRRWKVPENGGKFVQRNFKIPKCEMREKFVMDTHNSMGISKRY